MTAEKRNRQITVWGIEATQNYLFLLGLVTALHMSPLLLAIVVLACGCFGSAFIIGATDHIKIGQPPTPGRWRDVVVNGAIFTGFGILYLLYNASGVGNLWINIALGFLLGGGGGLLQGLSVGQAEQRRISTSTLLHAAGIGLAGACVMALLWVLSGMLSTSGLLILAPVIALILDVLMTACIVLVEYRAIL